MYILLIKSKLILLSVHFGQAFNPECKSWNFFHNFGLQSTILTSNNPNLCLPFRIQRRGIPKCSCPTHQFTEQENSFIISAFFSVPKLKINSSLSSNDCNYLDRLTWISWCSHATARNRLFRRHQWKWGIELFLSLLERTKNKSWNN